MKPLLLCLAISLTGCATTKLFDAKTGKCIFATGADAATIDYSGQGVSFHATDFNHSRTNQIVAKGIQNGLTAGGAAVATSGLLSVIH